MPGLSRGQLHSLSCTTLPSASHSSVVEQRRRQQTSCSSLLLTQSIDDIKRLRDKARLLRNYKSSQLSTHFEESEFYEDQHSPLGRDESFYGSSEQRMNSTSRGRPILTDLDSSLRSLPAYSNQLLSASRRPRSRFDEMPLYNGCPAFPIGATTPMRRGRFGREVLTSTPLDVGSPLWDRGIAESDCGFDHRQSLIHDRRKCSFDEAVQRRERSDTAKGLRKVREILERIETAMVGRTGRLHSVDVAVQTDQPDYSLDIGVQVEHEYCDGLEFDGDRDVRKPGAIKRAMENIEPNSSPISTRATNSAAVSLIHSEPMSLGMEMDSPPKVSQIRPSKAAGPLTECLRGFFVTLKRGHRL